MGTLLSMRGVEKAFGAARALSGVDLDVLPGEVHALLGENGAGKSTLMKILSGALRADAGDIVLGGEPYRPKGPLDAEKLGLAMIYQERNLAPDLSVMENIVLGHEPAAFGVVDRERSRETAERALARLDHAELAGVRRVSDLGPGERQVVEIARALSRDARVIVMDEPTSSLSAADGERLLEIVSRLKAAGASIIYISHFLEEVERIADRFTVLRDGRAVASGGLAGTSRRMLLEHMAGRPLDQAFDKSPGTAGDEILVLDDLRGAIHPSGVHLSLRRGEILGFAGLLGAGRTELLRAVFGLDAVRAGRIRIGTVWDAGAPPWRRLEHGLGMLSEDRAGEGLALEMSIADNIVLSHVARLSRFGWVDRAARATRAEKWISSLGIRAASPGAAVSSLSGGNQQKVALARLLDLDVDVLLLDEPTRGVDAATKEAIYGLLRELAGRGKAVLFVSSYVPELLAACDRIAVMHRGALCAVRPTAEWTEAAILDAATRGADQ
jgi:ribose transport system ATP-binding protein